MAWNEDGKYYVTTSRDLKRAKKRLDELKNLSVTDEKAWNPSLWNFYGAQSLSGETVTEETALTYSAFWNAVNLISSTIASLPCHLMQRQGKKRQLADNRMSYNVLHDMWNPYMTAMVGRECLQAHILTWGNGYAEIERNTYGELVRLWPIPPNRVLKIEMREGGLWYSIKVDNENKWLPRRQILHIPGLGFDGFIGYSVVAMARKSLGLGMAMETFGSRFFGEGTHPDLFFSHPGQLGPQAKANLKESIIEYNSGLNKSHRMMFLEEGMKPEKIGVSPDDSQFLQSRQFQIPEIARWFNLPPHKLKDLTKSSFNNIESEQISFVTDSILPWLIRLEQNYNMQLLSERDRKMSSAGRFYFKHSVEGLLRGSPANRALFYKIMWGNGFLTINEIRELEDKDPDSNPLADELFIMANMIPLSKFDDFMTEKNSSNDQSSSPGNIGSDTDLEALTKVIALRDKI